MLASLYANRRTRCLEVTAAKCIARCGVGQHSDSRGQWVRLRGRHGEPEPTSHGHEGLALEEKTALAAPTRAQVPTRCVTRTPPAGRNQATQSQPGRTADGCDLRGSSWPTSTPRFRRRAWCQRGRHRIDQGGDRSPMPPRHDHAEQGLEPRRHSPGPPPPEPE